MNSLESEENLLKGLASGNRQATETIYRNCYPVIAAMVNGNNGSEDDAADVFQEGMIILFEKAAEPGFHLTAQIKTYLYAVCRRIWLKKLQAGSRFSGNIESMAEVVSVEDDLEMHLQKNLEFATMEDSLLKVGEPCKSLLEAYYLQKQGMQEIAEKFGYTNADNAKTQKYKCLIRLKKIFFSRYKTDKNG